MKHFLKSKAEQLFSNYNEQQLREYASAKGKIYAIMNQAGQLKGTRRSYGSAARAVEKRYLLREAYTTEKLYVVPLDIKPLILALKQDTV